MEVRSRDNGFRWVALLSSIVFLLLWWLIDDQTWADAIERFRPFVEKVIEALFVASVLALTVDLFLKRQIARDAFEASIGYILPKYLQDEIRAIYSNEVVCIDHAQDVVIEELEGGLVKTKVRTQRKLKNISTNTHTLRLELDVDEWFESVGSAIGECGYRLAGGDAVAFDTNTRITTPVPKLVAKVSEGVELRPGSEIEVWQAFEEVKRRSDLQYLAFAYATDKPRVHVSVPEGFDFAVEFTHRITAKKLATGDTILPALLLPNQCIIVRWWGKAALLRWEQPARRS